MKASRITGWTKYAVEVHDRRGEPLPGYFGLGVRSWAGARDLSRSLVVKKPPIVPGGKPPVVYKGLYFDESKWDGSDVFRVGPGTIVVTKRVRDAFRRARVTNVRFTSLADQESSVGNFPAEGSD